MKPKYCNKSLPKCGYQHMKKCPLKTCEHHKSTGCCPKCGDKGCLGHFNKRGGGTKK